MNHVTNIFLIGPPGAGKSSIGREIAQFMERDFYDTDHVIKERTGVEIGWIFDREGEEGFRLRETETLRELASLSNVIIATGGGTALLEANQGIMSSGVIVYLQVGLDQQFERVAKNQLTRPQLRGVNIKERLVDVAKEHRDIYQSMADYVFITDRRTVRSLAKKIAEHLKREGY